MPKRAEPRSRAPLSRERVLAAAMALADASGLEAVTLRAVAARLGVEAMSLYKHVANKDDILDSLVELVVAEMPVPAPDAGWRAALRARALSAREILRRHRWAAMLLETRLAPGPARLRLYDGVLGALRRDGFSVELAYNAFLTLDSYIYGFTLQEAWMPFEPEQRSEVVERMRPAISSAEYPHLVEVMEMMMARSSGSAKRGGSSAAAYAADFEVGLDVILDGLERARGAAAPTRSRGRGRR